jgi:hypothetical protein
MRDPLILKLMMDKPWIQNYPRSLYVVPVQDVCFVGNNPVSYTDYLGLACGSGWSEIFVPDSPGGFDFSLPCENHDNCYDTCGMGKDDCDSGFFKDMMDVCSKYPEVVEGWCFSPYTHSYTICRDMPRAKCENYAETYFKAVREWGDGPYKKAQERNGCCGSVDNEE